MRIAKNSLPSMMLLLCCVAAFLLPPCSSSSGAEESPKWQQKLTAYFWLPAVNGDAVIQGLPSKVDVTFGDAWDVLTSLDATPVIQYEADKGRWGILTNLFYASLNNVTITARGPANSTSRQTIIELAATYAPLIDKITSNAYPVELIGGVRYTHLNVGLTGLITGAMGGSKQTWVDPFIGAQVSRMISNRWGYHVRGDVGGFGIGDASDFTWNVVAGLNYQIDPKWSLDFGWRWLDYDYETGAGTSFFKLDALFSGPFFGSTVKF